MIIQIKDRFFNMQHTSYLRVNAAYDTKSYKYDVLIICISDEVRNYYLHTDLPKTEAMTLAEKYTQQIANQIEGTPCL